MNNQAFEFLRRVESRLGIYIQDTSNELGRLIAALHAEGSSEQHAADLLRDSVHCYVRDGLAVYDEELRCEECGDDALARLRGKRLCANCAEGQHHG